MEDRCPHSMQDWYMREDKTVGCHECDEAKELAKQQDRQVYITCPHCGGRVTLGY